MSTGKKQIMFLLPVATDKNHKGEGDPPPGDPRVKEATAKLVNDYVTSQDVTSWKYNLL